MTSTPTPFPVSPKLLWTGRVLSALPVLLCSAGVVYSLLKPAAVAAGFAHYGYPGGALTPIIFVEAACVILYAIPRTSVLGAILLTGYMGGATATHVRAGEPFFIPVLVGIVAWAGLFLRDERLRDLLPLRS